MKPIPSQQPRQLPASTIHSTRDELLAIWEEVGPKTPDQLKFNRDIYVPIKSPRPDEQDFLEATLNARVFFYERDRVANKRKRAYINHARFLVAITVIFALASLVTPVSLFVSLVSLAFLSFSNVSVGRFKGLKVLRRDWLSARMDTELTRIFIGVSYIRWAHAHLSAKALDLADDWRELRDVLENSPSDKTKFFEEPSSLNGLLGLDKVRRTTSKLDLGYLTPADYKFTEDWAQRYQDRRTRWQMTYLNENRQADKEKLHRIDASCSLTLAASVIILVVLTVLSSTPALSAEVHKRVPLITPELLAWASKSAGVMAGVILTLAATARKYLDIESHENKVKRNDSFYARQSQIDVALDAILTIGVTTPSQVVAICQYCIDTEVASLQEHHRFLVDSQASKFSV